MRRKKRSNSVYSGESKRSNGKNVADGKRFHEGIAYRSNVPKYLAFLCTNSKQLDKLTKENIPLTTALPTPKKENSQKQMHQNVYNPDGAIFLKPLEEREDFRWKESCTAYVLI